MRWRLAGIAALAAAVAVRAAIAAPAPFRSFAALAIAPDGSRIALLETDVPPGGGEGRSHLVLRDAATGAPTEIALPCGDDPECSPGAPAWSPDSKRVAFTVRQPGSLARTIYTADANGGDLRRVAAFDGTVITLRYSRAGQLAALAVQNANKEAGASQAGAPLAGTVGADIREQRIAVVDGDHLRWASPPDLFVYEYAWLPDGSGFVGTASPGDGDSQWWVAKLYGFDGASGAARLIYGPKDRRQQITFPRVSPNGKSVAFIGGLMSDFGASGGDAFLVPVAGGEPANVTPGLHASVTSLAFACDGQGLIAGLQLGGEVGVARLRSDGEAPETLWQGAVSLFASDGVLSQACGAGPMTATIAESFDAADEVIAGPIGAWQRIMHENGAAQSAARAIDVHWRNDGMDMQGWLLLPRQGAAAPMPLVT
ncbi:MAG: PD40 domain-containing protein, partial [Acetobacteraceae bacterium]|nr:PD40 domain-containing protein [Acetobacteraceae bacterium]